MVFRGFSANLPVFSGGSEKFKILGVLCGFLGFCLDTKERKIRAIRDAEHYPINSSVLGVLITQPLPKLITWEFRGVKIALVRHVLAMTWGGGCLPHHYPN